MTRDQQKLLNAACGDLATGLRWDSAILNKDEWRMLMTSAIIGQRRIRNPLGGIIIMGRSSKELSTAEASEAITLCYSIGDAPHEYGVDAKQVRWCNVIKLARGIGNDEV